MRWNVAYAGSPPPCPDDVLEVEVEVVVSDDDPPPAEVVAPEVDPPPLPLADAPLPAVVLPLELSDARSSEHAPRTPVSSAAPKNTNGLMKRA